MKLENFITKLEKMEAFEIRRYFDKTFESLCPCFSGRKIKLEDKFIKIQGHCWRTEIDDGDCPYSGIHITTNLDAKIAKKIGKIILNAFNEEEWTTWSLVINDRTIR